MGWDHASNRLVACSQLLKVVRLCLESVATCQCLAAYTLPRRAFDVADCYVGECVQKVLRSVYIAPVMRHFAISRCETGFSSREVCTTRGQNENVPCFNVVSLSLSLHTRWSPLMSHTLFSCRYNHHRFKGIPQHTGRRRL